MGGMGDDVSGGCKKGPKPPVPSHHTHRTLPLWYSVYGTLPPYTLYHTLHHTYTPHCAPCAYTYYTLRTIPYSPTAHPADYSPCSGPLVTNRMLQATNITIEDRWQGVQRKTHKTRYCSSKGGERNRISVCWGTLHAQRRTLMAQSVQRRTCKPPRRGSSCPDLPRPLNAPNSSRINHNTAQLYNVQRTMHRSQHFICPLSRRRAAPAATERGQKLRRWPCDAIENQTRPIQYHKHSQTLLQSQLDLLFTFERVGDCQNVGQVGQQGKRRLVPSDGCRQNIGSDADLWKAIVTELIRKMKMLFNIFFSQNNHHPSNQTAA